MTEQRIIYSFISQSVLPILIFLIIFCFILNVNDWLPEEQVSPPSWYLQSSVPFRFLLPPPVLGGHQLISEHNRIPQQFEHIEFLYQSLALLQSNRSIHFSWLLHRSNKHGRELELRSEFNSIWNRWQMIIQKNFNSMNLKAENWQSGGFYLF